MARKINMAAKMLREANNVYADGMIETYFDMKTGEERDDTSGGDTLALFIGREVSGLTDENDTPAENRATLEAALTRAADELDSVICHFRGGLQCGTGCGACRQVRA